MTIERTQARAVRKPWGVFDIRPWSDVRHEPGAIGEIWYERSKEVAADPLLLLKLLFTSQPLSIQVHPDDAFAHSMGLARGKTEAWYILRATPDARVALGFDRRLTSQQLREAIDDGSISDLVVWKAVGAGDVIFVPAGTVHAIGAGLVMAEIQQRSDSTFRLFDYGRQRALDIEKAVAVSNAGPAHFQVKSNHLTDERTLLVASPHFVLERLELNPNAARRLEVERETWLLLISGAANVGSFDLAIGDAIFMQADRADIQASPSGMVCLLAYTGGDFVPDLLQFGGPRGALNEGAALAAPNFVPATGGATPEAIRPYRVQ